MSTDAKKVFYNAYIFDEILQNLDRVTINNCKLVNKTFNFLVRKFLCSMDDIRPRNILQSSFEENHVATGETDLVAQFVLKFNVGEIFATGNWIYVVPELKCFAVSVYRAVDFDFQFYLEDSGHCNYRTCKDFYSPVRQYVFSPNQVIRVENLLDISSYNFRIWKVGERSIHLKFACPLVELIQHDSFFISEPTKRLVLVSRIFRQIRCLRIPDPSDIEKKVPFTWSQRAQLRFLDRSGDDDEVQFHEELDAVQTLQERRRNFFVTVLRCSDLQIMERRKLYHQYYNYEWRTTNRVLTLKYPYLALFQYYMSRRGNDRHSQIVVWNMECGQSLPVWKYKMNDLSGCFKVYPAALVDDRRILLSIPNIFYDNTRDKLLYFKRTGNTFEREPKVLWDFKLQQDLRKFHVSTFVKIGQTRFLRLAYSSATRCYSLPNFVYNVIDVWNQFSLLNTKGLDIYYDGKDIRMLLRELRRL